MTIFGAHLTIQMVVFLSLMLILAVAFVAFFQIPAWIRWLQLMQATRRFRQLRSDAEHQNTYLDPDEVARLVMNREPFRRLWNEYSKTLHPQNELVGGKMMVKAVRATVPAETFFTTQVLVDTFLNLEFFKHAPGIFTGLGILGTFNGLIIALRAFSVPKDATQLPTSVKGLLDGVSEAFIVSAGAIGAAMLVTVLERVAVTRRFAQVEKLCAEIDSAYQAGAGEEYLARLVVASEESATQATQLKDVLVSELTHLLTELTERQIAASQSQSQALAESLAKTITTGFTEPVRQLTDVVKLSTGSQGEQVHGMLENLISAFMAKLDDTFGGQMRGLNTLLENTTRSMQAMQAEFSEMLSKMSTAGSSAGDAMSRKLEEAMANADLRQREMNNLTAKFIEQIRSVVSQSQSETSTQLRELLGKMHTSVDALVVSLAEQQTKVGATVVETTTQLASTTKGAIDGMSGQVEELLKGTNDATVAIRDSIAALRAVTTESIDKLNSGAETMYLAASEFKSAGDTLSGTFDRADQVSDRLVATGADLSNASRAVQAVVSEYERTRDGIGTMLVTLQGIVEAARKDAGLSTQLVRDMQASLDAFTGTQKNADEYLDKVSGVLEAVFRSFDQSLTARLNKTLQELDGPLGQAVDSLKVTIQDLAETQGMRPTPPIGQL